MIYRTKLLLAVGGLLALLFCALWLVPSAAATSRADNPNFDTVEVFLKNPVLDPYQGSASTLYIQASGIYIRYCADDQGQSPTLIITHLGTFEHRIEAFVTRPTLSGSCYKTRTIGVWTYLGGGYPAGVHTWWINRESYTVTIPTP